MGGGTPCTQALLDADKCVVPEAHPSIFLLRTANIDFDGQTVAVSFCVLVVLTIGIEKVFAAAEHAVRQRAPVYSLVGEKIVKELMILGLISFSIFVGEQAFHLNTTAFYLPLEFSHIVIFVLAILYVMEALYFLYLSGSTCAHFDTCLATKKADIEAQLALEWQDPQTGEDLWRGSFWQALRWRWSKLHEIADMQIIHTVFIQKHRLPEQFDFGRYLIHSFDAEIGSVLDISPMTWGCSIVLVWVCYVVAWACEIKGSEEAFWAFVLLGICLFSLPIGFLMVANRARRDAVRLALGLELDKGTLVPAALAQHALMHMKDDLDIDQELRRRETAESDKRSSKVNVHAQRPVLSSHRLPGTVGSWRQSASTRSSGIGTKTTVENPLVSSANIEGGRKTESEFDGLSVMVDESSEVYSNNSKRIARSGRLENQQASLTKHNINGEHGYSSKSMQKLKATLHVVGSAMHLKASVHRKRMSLNTAKKEIVEQSVAQWDLSSAFLISPAKIRFCFETTFVIRCLYLAVFFCYFAPSLQLGRTIETLGLCIVLGLEVLFHVIVGPLAIQTFYFMNAVSTVKPDVLGAVVEDMELARTLKLHLLHKLNDFAISDGQTTVTQEWLKAKFASWAALGADDGLVDRHELKVALSNMHVYLSSTAFNRLMRLLDPNRSGFIEFEEFGAFVCSLTPEQLAVDADVDVAALRSTSSRKVEAAAKEAVPHEGKMKKPAEAAAAGKSKSEGKIAALQGRHEARALSLSKYLPGRKHFAKPPQQPERQLAPLEIKERTTTSI